MKWNPGLRERRAAAALGVLLLAASVALFIRAAGVEPRALEVAGAACDADAARAARVVGPLLAFRDANGALAAVRETIRDRRLVSTVVLDSTGHVSAAHAVPIPGLAHVSRAEVFFEERRMGSIVLGFSLEDEGAGAAKERVLGLAVAGSLALIGLSALAAAVLGQVRSRIKSVSAEHARVVLEREVLAARAAEMENRLGLERRDRRFAESALSARDLFEIERTGILEMIACGDELPSILSSLAALVEHRRPNSQCIVAPLRQGVLPVRSAGDAFSRFGGRGGPVSIGSAAPPLALAAEMRCPVVTRDVPGDPLWESGRALFASHGIAACWSVPIEAGNGTVFGTLSLLLPEPAAPGTTDLALLENAARLAAIAIEQRQLSDQLAFQARYDRLTNLPNRLYLEEALRAAVSRAARRDERVTLLFVDLDRFKRVNDTFGHGGGDALLSQVGIRLAAAVDEGDLVARMGGDEFCVLRVGPKVEGHVELSRRVLESLRAPFDILGEEVVVGASVGVSLYPDDAHDAMALQMHADAAMYAAKEEAGSGCHLFEPGQTFRGGDRLRLENDLRRAIAGGELSLAFQPQADLDGLLRGVEALVRWRHPILGDVRPSRFVSIAEESGLILELGAWVFEEVCRRIGSWRAAGLPLVPVSVNVSPVQFSRTDLVEIIEASLAAHGVPANLIRLELTETLLVKDVAATRTLLGRLKNLGVGLAVDDFGTGYSSLSYLQLLPIDELKIDQAFVRELGTIETNARAPKLVQSMVALGHSLGLVVVAEGVETRAQLEFLTRIGCDRVQGYVIGRPMSSEALTRLLAVSGRPMELQLNSAP